MQTADLETAGGVATVTVHLRPVNAPSTPLRETLRAATAGLHDDGTRRAVLLTEAGEPVFVPADARQSAATLPSERAPELTHG